jgi:hypothetical protein
MPEVPADSGQPGAPSDRSKPDAGPAPTPMPSVPAETTSDSALARDVFFADGGRAAVGPNDSAGASFGQDDENGSLPTIAGVLFTASLGGSLAVARDQAAERRRRLVLR